MHWCACSAQLQEEAKRVSASAATPPSNLVLDALYNLRQKTLGPRHAKPQGTQAKADQAGDEFTRWLTKKHITEGDRKAKHVFADQTRAQHAEEKNDIASTMVKLKMNFTEARVERIDRKVENYVENLRYAVEPYATSGCAHTVFTQTCKAHTFHTQY